MQTIRLTKGIYKYKVEDQLGPEGGFGRVFLGYDQSNQVVAIKKIEVAELSHRELKIASELIENDYEHIIKIIDFGQDAESGDNYIVMTKAEKSLQDYINESGKVDEKEAINILCQIVKGLREVSDIVHRDLKPGNILLQKGKWKISDFGIARFVEESTSLNTLKGFLSEPYAAPEQWNLEHSTNATDIYALGCIGYTLLNGFPPFKGPLTEDFKKQHLNDVPPILENHNPGLISLLSLMLRKRPEVRPSIKRIKEVLEKISKNTLTKDVNSGYGLLARAGEMVIRHKTEEESFLIRAENEKQRRRDIVKEAKNTMVGIKNNLFKRILDSAPSAELLDEHDISLGDANLKIKIDLRLEYIDHNAFSNSKWDVLTGYIIVVTQNKPSYNWSSNLWYMRTNPSEDYRWYEVSYMETPLAIGSTRKYPYAPFALGDIEKADFAASNIISEYQIAWGPTPIDLEDSEDFYDRWINIFAQGVEGKLRYPSHLPLNKSYFDRL